jgi:hypothetical protein
MIFPNYLNNNFELIVSFEIIQIRLYTLKYENGFTKDKIRSNLFAINSQDERILWHGEIPNSNITGKGYTYAEFKEKKLWALYGDLTFVEIDIQTGKILSERFHY